MSPGFSMAASPLGSQDPHARGFYLFYLFNALGQRLGGRSRTSLAVRWFTAAAVAMASLPRIGLGGALSFCRW